MYILAMKLKHVKHHLKEWNKDYFKNIFKEKGKIEEDLRLLYKEFCISRMEKYRFLQEKELLKSVGDILAKEEIL